LILPKIPKNKVDNLLQILIWSSEIILLESEFAIKALSQSSFAFSFINQNPSIIATLITNPLYEKFKSQNPKQTIFSPKNNTPLLKYEESLRKSYNSLFTGKDIVK